MNILSLAFKLLMGPLGKMIGGWLKLGGAFLAGAKHQKAKQTKQAHKSLVKNTRKKNEVKNRIKRDGINNAIDKLHSKWTRNG